MKKVDARSDLFSYGVLYGCDLECNKIAYSVALGTKRRGWNPSVEHPPYEQMT
jgi:hypothetical protein